MEIQEVLWPTFAWFYKHPSKRTSLCDAECRLQAREHDLANKVPVVVMLLWMRSICISLPLVAEQEHIKLAVIARMCWSALPDSQSSGFYLNSVN